MEPTVETADRWRRRDDLMTIARSGDILFRKSDAKGPLGLPFTRLVAKVTDSPYTHAAMLYWDHNDLYVFEVTDIGTMSYRVLDYFEFCLDLDYVIYRLTDMDPVIENLIVGRILSFLELDPVYDYTFNDPNKFYCTEAVAYIYSKMSYDLCRPKTIKEIVGFWSYQLIRIGNWLYSKLAGGTASLDMTARMYYVGNRSNGGLMSSKLLELIYINQS